MVKQFALSMTAALVLLFPNESQAQVSDVERLAVSQPPTVVAHLGNSRGYLEGGYSVQAKCTQTPV